MLKIKEKLKTLAKKCSICSKSMRVIVYKNRAYRGGHYFGKIPLYKKAELQKAIKAGTRQTHLGKMTFTPIFSIEKSRGLS